jgi:hypothetical protein
VGQFIVVNAGVNPFVPLSHALEVISLCGKLSLPVESRQVVKRSSLGS